MKRVLIIGAGGNIGSATSEYFKMANWKVASHHKDLASDDEKHLIFSQDLSRPSEAINLIKRSWEKLDGLDALVYAASFFNKMKFGTISEKDFDDALKVDLKSAFFITQDVAQRMKKQGSGSIVILSDSSSDNPYSEYIPYFIAKAGVNAFVRACAKILKPEVKINAIAPYIVTRPKDMDDKTWGALQKKAPRGRATRPTEVAALIFEIINSDRTGEIIPC